MVLDLVPLTPLLPSPAPSPPLPAQLPPMDSAMVLVTVMVLDSAMDSGLVCGSVMLRLTPRLRPGTPMATLDSLVSATVLDLVLLTPLLPSPAPLPPLPAQLPPTDSAMVPVTVMVLDSATESGLVCGSVMLRLTLRLRPGTPMATLDSLVSATVLLTPLLPSPALSPPLPAQSPPTDSAMVPVTVMVLDSAMESGLVCGSVMLRLTLRLRPGTPMAILDSPVSATVLDSVLLTPLLPSPAPSPPLP